MHRLFKTLAALLLAAVFTAATCLAALPVSAGSVSSTPVRRSAIKQKPASADPKGGAGDDEIVTIMVKLTGDPLLAASESGADNDALRSHMERRREAVMRNISDITGHDVEAIFSYSLLFNGFAFTGRAGLIDIIAELDGVSDCYRSMSWSVPEYEDKEDTKVGTSVGVINADDMWNAGYTGTGMVIAVIDTGILQEHNNFSVPPTNPRYTAETVQTALSAYDFNCESLYNGVITGSALYYNAKIPYRFNYVTGTTDASHSTSRNDHGTHVSSIAAGNDDVVKGVAFNAQIVAMQVFEGGSAEWSTILAALEDCAYLGVDCVNMSLGADCGFTTGEADMEEAFTLLYNAGTNLSCAAGNSGYAGSGNAFGFNQNLAMNPDNGLVSTPSTYSGSISVAACSNSVAGQLAYFSSWGTTSDLCIKPEIMAPGMSIYAATASSNSYSSYGTKSGTSMATPEISGCIALLTQYVSANYNRLTRTEQMELVNTLMLSTCRPRMNSSSIPFSPRVQGAGLVDIQAAMNTPVYVSVANSSRPKLEIGDDPARTGVFTLQFDLNNLSATSQTYMVSANVQTEAATARTVNGVSTYTMSGSPRSLNANSVITGGGNIVVPANGSVSVTMTIDMSAYGAELDSMFPNGIYIEGFVTIDGETDLSIPYLGFYGDWDAPSVIDRTFYWDIICGEASWSSHDYPNVAGSSYGASSYLELGANPFIETNDFLMDRISISPNGDGIYDAVDVIYTGLLRNCRELVYTVSDSSGAELMREAHEFMWKGISTDDGFVPAGYSDGYGAFSGWNGGDLSEGATATVRIDATLDSPGFDPANNECAYWEFPVTIDSAAPEFVYWRIENGALILHATDSHYLAYIGVYSDPSYANLIEETAVCETSRGALSLYSFDIGGASTVYVKLGDYAGNTSTQALSGEGGSLNPVELDGIALDMNEVAIYEGGSAVLNILREPLNANNFNTVWTVADPSVASVRGGVLSATITGISSGSTSVSVTATDRATGDSYTAYADITVLNFPTISEALNVMGGNIEFITIGNYAWTVDMASTPDRTSVKSSNASVHNSSSVVQSQPIELFAGDTVTFDWMVSSESSYDYLNFIVNNSTVSRISGNQPWTQHSYVVPSDGAYTFGFSYTKDGSVSSGDDCGWVDEFTIVSEYAQIPGDVDGNGAVESSDALAALRCFMSLTTLTPAQAAAADVNGNGVVDTGDALLIIRYYLGLIDSLGQ